MRYIHENHIAEAMTVWRTDPSTDNFKTLVWILERPISRTLDVSAADDVEKVICQAWFDIFDFNVQRDKFLPGAVEILSNVLVGDRWRGFMDSGERVYSFTGMAILYLRVHAILRAQNPGGLDPYIEVNRSLIAHQMLEAFGPWLPASCSPASLSALELATAFFGEVWSALAAIYSNENGLVDYIAVGRPPLRPGLREIEDNVSDEMLPELDLDANS